MPFEKASMAILVVVVCISTMFNFVDLAMTGSNISANSDYNVSSMSNASTINAMQQISNDFNKSVSSGFSLGTLTYGVTAIINLTFFVIGAIVSTPGNITLMINKIAFLLEGSTIGPIHILFGITLAVLSIILLWGLFNILRDIARIIRGAGG